MKGQFALRTLLGVMVVACLLCGGLVSLWNANLRADRYWRLGNGTEVHFYRTDHTYSMPPEDTKVLEFTFPDETLRFEFGHITTGYGDPQLFEDAKGRYVWVESSSGRGPIIDLKARKMVYEYEFEELPPEFSAAERRKAERID